MINSVHIGDVDHSIYTKGARTLKVKVSSSNSFETPTRPISTMELSAKSFLGYRGELQAPISALPVDLSSGDRFEKFLKNNGMVKDTVRKLQSMSDSTYMCPSFPILQLPSLNPNNMLPFKIAFDMQCSVEGMDYVNIPAIEGGVNVFEKIVNDWCQCSEDNFDKGAVPQIKLAEDPDTFSKKLNILCELSKTGLITIVNLVYTNPANCVQQLAELWNRREDLWAIVNCSEVPSKGNAYSSGIYADLEEYLIQHGIDSITRRKRTMSPKSLYALNRKGSPGDLNDIDSFDIAIHDASIRISKDLWNSTNHPLICNCSVCRGNSREQIIDRFAYRDNGEIARSGLRYYSKIHDHQSDQLELSRMRKFIKSNEMNEYELKIESDRNKLLASL